MDIIIYILVATTTGCSCFTLFLAILDRKEPYSPFKAAIAAEEAMDLAKKNESRILELLRKIETYEQRPSR